MPYDLPVVMYFCRLRGYDPVAQQEVVFYYSTHNSQFRNFLTVDVGGTNIPTNVYYNPRIVEPGNYQITLFDSPFDGGIGSSGAGTFVITNADGLLDQFADYGYDGRLLEVWRGVHYRSDNSITISDWFQGTIETLEVSFSKTSPSRFSFTIRNNLIYLDKDIQTTLYAGNNSLPNGIEGTADDIKGNPKPLCYGQVFNISPVLVNTSRMIFQIHAGSILAVDVVYDRGVSLARDTAIGNTGDFATSAALMSASVGASKYATCLAEGLIKLGTIPAGEITVDCRGDSTGGYIDNVGEIVQRIILRHTSITVGLLKISSFTALTSLVGYAVGIFIRETIAVRDVLFELLSSIGGFGYFDRSNLFTVGRFELPSGAASQSIANLIELDKNIASFEDTTIPTYQVHLSYQKNYTPQNSQSLAGASQSRIAFTNLEYRKAIATDALVSIKHLLSKPVYKDTLILSESNAIIEANRLLTLFKTLRNRYSVKIKSYNTTIQLNDIVLLQVNRFGLNLGKKFRVIGITEEASTNDTTLDLWGGV